MNTKTTYADKKVEFKTEMMSISGYRKVYYRIVPTELSWWKRTYCNPWVRMYRAFKFLGGTIDIFDIKDYHDMVFPLKTYGEVIDFLAEQKEIGDKVEAEIEAWKQERIAKGEEWPD